MRFLINRRTVISMYIRTETDDFASDFDISEGDFQDLALDHTRLHSPTMLLLILIVLFHLCHQSHRQMLYLTTESLPA